MRNLLAVAGVFLLSVQTGEMSKIFPSEDAQRYRYPENWVNLNFENFHYHGNNINKIEHKIHSNVLLVTPYIQFCLSDAIHAIRLILQILFNVEVGHEPCETDEPVKFKFDMSNFSIRIFWKIRYSRSYTQRLFKCSWRKVLYQTYRQIRRFVRNFYECNSLVNKEMVTSDNQN